MAAGLCLLCPGVGPGGTGIPRQEAVVPQSVLRGLSWGEFVGIVGAAVDVEDWLPTRGNDDYNAVRAATLIAEQTAQPIYLVAPRLRTTRSTTHIFSYVFVLSSPPSSRSSSSPSSSSE